MAVTANNDTRNIRLGTCRVTYAGVDLGLTIGGVELTVDTSTHETKVDQFGETAVDEIITGRNIKAKVPLAETTLDNLVKIMPGATLVEETGKKRVEVTTGVGVSLLSLAQELRLHPISLADSDKSEDVVIYKAATPGSMNFAYKLDQERVYNTEFKGYPDPATGKLFYVGNDPAKK